MTYAELEIGLHRLTPGPYHVELRFSDPASDAEVAPVRGEAPINLDELRKLQLAPDEYGRLLAGYVFQDSAVKARYGEFKATIERLDAHLRVRLLIGPSAPELHGLRWELLSDPGNSQRLSTSERILFSRFMLSSDWRPIKLRPKADLKALVAVAAPSDLAGRNLADVDLDGEIQRAQESLAGIDVTVAGKAAPLTLDRLVDELRKGVDILYLVCHGFLGKEPKEGKEGAYLVLEDDEKHAVFVKASEFAGQLRRLAQLPRLVVLASCESAGKGDGPTAEVDSQDRSAAEGDRPTAQTSLAPLLAEAGVPAVMAMQGKISMTTVEQIMPVFFSELIKDGQIDRAMAVARGRHKVERHQVALLDDHWMPALFLRLRQGRIWYVPGFGDSGEDFTKWESICGAVQRGEVVPILGPDFGESVFGGSSERAADLAQQGGFPMEKHNHTDLAKVCQYLAIDQDRDTALDLVRRQFGARLEEAAEKRLGADHGIRSKKELVKAVAASLREDETNPYTFIARLPSKLYVNAGNDLMLFEALEGAALLGSDAATRSPERLAFQWRSTEDFHPKQPQFSEPSVERPIVYQVFGDVRDPKTLVLTEDDFFDYLIEMHYHRLMPVAVNGLLTRSSLLFLGFRLTDWTFRVLFRMIMNQKGLAGIRGKSHVGVQVDPEDNDFEDVQRARNYLGSYFGKGIRAGRAEVGVDIYWGSTEDFLAELRKQLRERPSDAHAEAVVTPPGADDGW